MQIIIISSGLNSSAEAGAKKRVTHFINVHEQIQLNRVCCFLFRSSKCFLLQQNLLSELIILYFIKYLHMFNEILIKLLSFRQKQ